ncbi:MAG: NAD-binding protein [Thainema sp.]
MNNQSCNDDQEYSDFTSLANDASLGHFIVCGLGSLGQHCILNLDRFASDEFGITLVGVDQEPAGDWEIDNLSDLLAQPPIRGDCRREDILKQSGIHHCRAILLVTSDESINVEAAIAVRRLNPTVQIVVRSSRENLNQLLERQLGNFVALDATKLPAITFALAGLGGEILGIFNKGSYWFRVVQQRVAPTDYRFDKFPIHRLHRKHHRLLDFQPAYPYDLSLRRATTGSSIFHRWLPDMSVNAGDWVAYVELMENSPNSTPQAQLRSQGIWQRIQSRLQDLIQDDWRQRLARFWQWGREKRIQRMLVFSTLTAVSLWVIGTMLLKLSVSGLTWQKAMSLGVILLLGGYGDVFGGLDADPIPGWIQFVCLLITLTSLLVVLGILGLIAEQLLSSRFEFLQRRPPVPKSDHVVVVGLGRVGQQIIQFLQTLNQPLVVITEQIPASDLLSRVPVFSGPILRELANVNLATAKSVIAVTDDQMLNLEVALTAVETADQVKHPIHTIIRTSDQSFSNNLVALLPNARAFSAYALSAEAFAGAAFGEDMLSLFPLSGQTILVAEYEVTEGDTLVGKLLAQVAYGYGVVPVYYLRSQTITGEVAELIMPSDDWRLHAGDRVVLLSSINGLRRIERGELTPPRRWQLIVKQPLNREFTLEAGNTLANISGCDLEIARAFMQQLPGEMELELYDYQAHRLLQELRKQIPVKLMPLEIPHELPT